MCGCLNPLHVLIRTEEFGMTIAQHHDCLKRLILASDTIVDEAPKDDQVEILRRPSD